MHRAQAKTDDGQYGLGWWIKDQSGYHILSAKGGTTDSYACVHLVPSEDIAVVVIANSYADFVSRLPDRILSVLLSKFASKPESRPAEVPVTNSDKTSALAGRWTGLVLTYQGSVPISLEIGSGHSIRGQVGTQPIVDLGNASSDPSGLYGERPGDPAIADAPQHKYVLELNLALRGDDLIGAATSRPPSGEDGDELPHWVKLTRAK